MPRSLQPVVWFIIALFCAVTVFAGDYGIKWSHGYDGGYQTFSGPPQIFWRTNDSTLIVKASRVIGINAEGDVQWNQPGIGAPPIGIDPKGRLVTVEIKTERHESPNPVCSGSRCLRLLVDRYQVEKDIFVRRRHSEYLHDYPTGEGDRQMYGAILGPSGSLYLFTSAFSGQDVVLELNPESDIRAAYPAGGMDYSGFLVGVAEDRIGNSSVLAKYYNYKGSRPEGGAWPWTHATTGLPDGYEFPGSHFEDFVPKAIAVDPFGGVLVAGGGGPNARQQPMYYGGPFKVVKYAANRSFSWLNTYPDPNNYGGVAFVVGTGEDGAVYAAGNHNLSKEANSDGLLPSAYVTMKFSREGIPLWTNTVSSASHVTGEPSILLVDKVGDVVVAGTSFRGRSDYDYFIVKYSSEGAVLWSRRFPRDSSDPTEGEIRLDPRKLVQGPDGSYFYSSLSFDNSLREHVAEVTKLSREGAILWQRQSTPPSSAGAAGQVVTGDQEGSSYVSGYLSGPSDNWVTIKYQSDGQPLWTNRSDSLPNARDFMVGIESARSGSVLLLAAMPSVPEGYRAGFFLRKISLVGESLWQAAVVESNIGSLPSSTHYPLGFAIDDDEGIHVAALSVDSSDLQSLEMIRFDSSGAILWTNRVPVNLSETIRLKTAGILIAGNRNDTYVACPVTVPNPQPFQVTGALLHFDSAGVIASTNFLDAPPSSLFLDDEGNLYASHYQALLSKPAYVFTTIKYDKRHVPIWTNLLERARSEFFTGPPEPSAIQDPRGNVVVISDPTERQHLLELGLCRLFDFRRQSVMGWHHSLGVVFTVTSGTTSRPGEWRATSVKDLPRVKRTPLSTSVEILLSPMASYRVDRGGTVDGPWLQVGNLETDFLGDGRFTDTMPPETNTFYRFIALGP